jgi:protein-disulfide isomerase
MKKIKKRRRMYLALAAVFAVLSFLSLQWIVRNDANLIVHKDFSRIRSLDERDHIIGKLGAPIELIVYMNPDCTYCKRFHETTVSQLHATYKENIVIAYRYMTIPLFPNSLNKMKALECAFEQQGPAGYETALRYLFLIQDAKKELQDTDMRVLAQSGSLDEVKLQSCIPAEKTLDRVMLDIQEARAAAINFTPTTIVRSGERTIIVSGNFLHKLEAAVDLLLLSKVSDEK